MSDNTDGAEEGAGLNDEYISSTIELIRNGELINWDYWSAVQIDAHSGARLAHGIDPIRWPADHHAQGHMQPELNRKIRRLELWLTSNGPAKFDLIQLAHMLGDFAQPRLRETANRLEMRRASATPPCDQAPQRDKLSPSENAGADRWTREQRAALLRDHDGGMTQQRLADRHNVTRQRISKLLAEARDERRPSLAQTGNLPRLVRGRDTR